MYPFLLILRLLKFRVPQKGAMMLTAPHIFVEILEDVRCECMLNCHLLPVAAVAGSDTAA